MIGYILAFILVMALACELFAAAGLAWWLPLAVLAIALVGYVVARVILGLIFGG